MAGSIREALSEAFDDLSEGTVEPSAAPAPIVDDAPATELAPLEQSTDSTIDKPLEEANKPIPERKDRKMFKDGKLVPVVAEPAVAENAKPVVPKVKAPQSWRPEMRANWEKLDPQIQAEINKREQEISRGLNEAASARKFNQEFSETVRPFEALIRGSGVNPLQAVRNLMSTAATLQTGTQAQRANTVANIIKAYGVDIATLDAVLTGRQPKPEMQQQDQILRAIDERLKPVTQFMTQAQQQQQERASALTQESQQTIQQFADDPKNEYYEDLREDMADLLEMAATRGRTMTIQEAYDRAAAVHPEISKLVARKTAAQRATEGRTSVERARRAASSQSGGSPAMGGRGGAPKGSKAALAQAWDDLST